MQNTGFIAAYADAFGYLLRGLHLVRTPGLRRYVAIPLLVNILCFGVLGWLLWDSFDNWLDQLSWFDDASGMGFLALIGTLLRWLAALILLLASAYAFTLFANVIGAPFNGLLAERVQRHLTGVPPEQGSAWREFLTALPRTIHGEIAKWIYLALWLVPLLLLQLVPLINVVAPLLLFTFGAWMMAIEYMDYPLGNHGLGFRQVRATLRARRGLALGFGTSVALVTLIPVVNLFVMPIAVAGATALYVERMR